MFQRLRHRDRAQPVALVDAALWQGELGVALRANGLDPQGPGNRGFVSCPVAARTARARTLMENELHACTERLNGQFAGCRLAVTLVIDARHWEGALRPLLAHRMASTPYDDWNTRFHAADARTARITGLILPPPDRADPAVVAARLTGFAAIADDQALAAAVKQLAATLWAERTGAANAQAVPSLHSDRQIGLRIS